MEFLAALCKGEPPWVVWECTLILWDTTWHSTVFWHTLQTSSAFVSFLPLIVSLCYFSNFIITARQRPAIIPVTCPFTRVPGVLQRIQNNAAGWNLTRNLYSTLMLLGFPGQSSLDWSLGSLCFLQIPELLFLGQRMPTEVSFRTELAHRRLFLVGKPKTEAPFLFSKKNKLKRIFSGGDASDFRFYLGFNWLMPFGSQRWEF